MIALSFVDTNILVYAEDLDAGTKHEIARELLLELWQNRQGVVSVQVLQEFFVTATRKLAKPLSHQEAVEIVEGYLSWRHVSNTDTILRAAMTAAMRFQLSFWDASIVAAAQTAGCAILYTEDLTDGQVFGDLRVVNPFRS